VAGFFVVTRLFPGRLGFILERQEGCIPTCLLHVSDILNIPEINILELFVGARFSRKSRKRGIRRPCDGSMPNSETGRRCTSVTNSETGAINTFTPWEARAGRRTINPFTPWEARAGGGC